MSKYTYINLVGTAFDKTHTKRFLTISALFCTENDIEATREIHVGLEIL